MCFIYDTVTTLIIARGNDSHVHTNNDGHLAVSYAVHWRNWCAIAKYVCELQFNSVNR